MRSYPPPIPGAELENIWKMKDDQDATILVDMIQKENMREADKRLDVAASAIFFNARIDQLASVDLSYAPPFSPPIDLIATTANITENKLDGIAQGIPPLEAKNIMDQNTDLLLLDVHNPQEYTSLKLPDSRVINIPLGELRERIDEVPRDKEILTFCKVSMRGYEAQRILQSAGIENVRFIEGGLLSWPFELWSSQ